MSPEASNHSNSENVVESSLLTAGNVQGEGIRKPAVRRMAENMHTHARRFPDDRMSMSSMSAQIAAEICSAVDRIIKSISISSSSGGFNLAVIKASAASCCIRFLNR